MKFAKPLVFILCTAVLNAMAVAHGATQKVPLGASENPVIVGDWRGESTCVVRESACHDEDSLYHVTKLAQKPGWFSMKLDKIVNGKPVTMGTMDCSYDPPKQSLTCEFPRGVMRFLFSRGEMVGTMTLPDGTVWRKLTLKKS